MAGPENSASIAVPPLHSLARGRLPKPSKLNVVSFRNVGARMRALRLEHGYTQARLARLLGTSQTALSEMERGNRGISLQQVVKLSRALRVSPNAILGEHDGASTKEMARPRTHRILRRLHLIEKLPEEQQDAVLKLLDGIIQAHVVRD
jgi:transcriptional regulator with XRE-family HTH domain